VKETTQPSSAQPTAATGPKPDVFARAYAAFTALPRVGKWVAVAAAFYIVFLLFQFVVWPVADDLNEEADRAAVLLKSAGTRAEVLPRDIADRAVVFGPNSVPGREITEKERFSNAVAAITAFLRWFPDARGRLLVRTPAEQAARARGKRPT
jgi:hypothetical protein